MKEYKVIKTCDNCNQNFDITIPKIYKGDYDCTVTGTTTFYYKVDCPYCGNKYRIPKATMNDLVSAIPNNKDDNCKHDMYYFNYYSDNLYEKSHSKCMKCGAECVHTGYSWKWINEEDDTKYIGEMVGMSLVCLIIFILLFIGCNIG